MLIFMCQQRQYWGGRINL